MRPFSEEEFVELYINQNKTQVEIASLFGVTRDYIHRYVQNRNIKKPTQLLTVNRQKTCLEKYGATSYRGSVEGALRIASTCEKKYGDSCSLVNPEVSLKARQTMKERYGVPYSGQSEELFAKKKETMKKRYGVEYYPQLGHDEEKSLILHDAVKLREYILTLPKHTLRYISQSLGYDEGAILYWLRKFSLEGLVEAADYESTPEREIKELVESWGIRTTKDKKNIWPYEIDIYCPDFLFGIEFNGNWWHREEEKGILYHQKKALKAMENGIQLFQIFEYEWNVPSVRERIISRLQNILKLNKQKVFARQCIVKEVSKKDKGEFLRENHVQGNDHATLSFGLYYDCELVAVMNFSKPRVNSEAEWELTRFACKRGMNIVGGASKLWAHFLALYPTATVVSYSDLTKTTGNIYQVLGFVRQKLNRPRYVWVKNNQVLSRFQTQIKQENKKMRERGFYKVYDAGTYTWFYGRG